MKNNKDKTLQVRIDSALFERLIIHQKLWGPTYSVLNPSTSYIMRIALINYLTKHEEVQNDKL
jgi:hypothetical protein